MNEKLVVFLKKEYVVPEGLDDVLEALAYLEAVRVRL